MYKHVAAAMGQETEDGRASVPLAQARSLLKFLLHSASFKAVNWMFLGS